MGTHPIFESDFDCLTDTQMPNVPCRFYARGQCRNGDTCNWLHDGGGDADPGGFWPGSSPEASILSDAGHDMFDFIEHMMARQETQHQRHFENRGLNFRARGLEVMDGLVDVEDGEDELEDDMYDMEEELLEDLDDIEPPPPAQPDNNPSRVSLNELHEHTGRNTAFMGRVENTIKSLESENKNLREENGRLRTLVEGEGDNDENNPRRTCILNCTICLDYKKLDQFLVYAPCGHMFCQSCNGKMQRTPTCPTCRQHIESRTKVFTAA